MKKVNLAVQVQISYSKESYQKRGIRLLKSDDSQRDSYVRYYYCREFKKER